MSDELEFDELPGLRKATLEIAYDNGGINRWRTELQALEEAIEIIRRWPGDAHAVDTWLSSLSEEDLNTVCAGEHSDVEILMQSAPEGADELLNEIFDPGSQPW